MVIKDKEMRASVHHNLRNPLTIIKGNIELLMIYRKKEDLLSSKEEEIFQIILEQIKRLEENINKL
jgi:K+-sensing histidine kinase KdpD